MFIVESLENTGNNKVNNSPQNPPPEIISVNVLVYFRPVFFLCIYNLFYYKIGIMLYLQICTLLSSLTYCKHFPMSINIIQKLMAI